MTKLDKLLADIYSNPADNNLIQRFYATFFVTQLIVPINKDYVATAEEPYQPLAIKLENQHYLLAFDNDNRFKNWAGDQITKISSITIAGKELITCLGENVILGLNVDTAYYKEFLPEEILHLKEVIAKLNILV